MILAGLALPGCAAGVIGLTAAIVGLSGSGGGSQAPAPDLPPVVRFIGAPELLVGPEGGPSRYRIRMRYSVTNEDGGTLGARVMATRVDDDGVPIGDPVPAAALPGCGDLLDGIPSGVERSFCWDVRATPGFENGASMVRLLINAVEDSRVGLEPQLSDPFLAGNTALTVRNLALAQNGEVLFGSFDLVDAEADSVPADERFLQLDLEVEVNLGDGQGFCPALEFPGLPSEGQAALCTLEPSRPDKPGACAGLAGTRAHVFLWDVVAQLAPDRRACACPWGSPACTRSWRAVVPQPWPPRTLTRTASRTSPLPTASRTTSRSCVAQALGSLASARSESAVFQ